MLFIATANIAETIPAPLLDRMEVVGFDGYTTEEKVAIARGYLWPRQLERNGLRDDEVAIGRRGAPHRGHRVHPRGRACGSSSASSARCCGRPPPRIASGEATAPVTVDVDAIREALGRQRFFQEAAERTAVPGVATGLSVTGAGGDVLFIEATAMPGKAGWS